MSYLYLKTLPPPARASSKPRFRRPGIPAKFRRPIALLLLGLGLYFVSVALLPIISFQIEYSRRFAQIVSPLASANYSRDSVLGDIATDYTQLNNWFTRTSPETLQSTSSSPSDHLIYQISIPKLKIINANVEIGSMDLAKSLIQYPQTALPGQLGNAVIFGHSVLPQFFNPKSYLTIFSTLYKLETGDEIAVDFDKIHYRYLVDEIYEVKPEDLSVLEQRFDGQYLTLITCSPPGTYLRRLVIKARIVDY